MEQEYNIKIKAYDIIKWNYTVEFPSEADVTFFIEIFIMISVNYSDYVIEFDKAEAKLQANDIKYRELIKSGINIQERSHFYIKSYGINLRLVKMEVLNMNFKMKLH